MLLVEYNDVAKALAPYRANHSLRVRILPWRSWCCYDFFDVHVLDPLAEEVAVDRIPVPDQEPWCLIFGKRFDYLLSRPLRCRMRRYVEVDDHTAVMAKYDKTEQDTKPRRRYGEGSIAPRAETAPQKAWIGIRLE